MNTQFFQVLLVSSFSLLSTLKAEEEKLPESEWTDLFEGEWENWNKWLGLPHYSVVLPGESAEMTDEERKKRPALGTKDPKEVYSFIEIDGKKTLKITGEVFGAITSKKNYQNYHLSLRVKWGQDTWRPRAGRERDSGLLLHCTGQEASFNENWMISVECQIQETDCGDLWLLGTKAKVPLRKKEREGASYFEYDPPAPLAEASRHVEHSASKEDLAGWNTIEAYVVGSTLLFVVNGSPNMAVFNATLAEDENETQLTSGKLQIQSEGAEVFYQDVKIRAIESFPEHLNSWIKEHHSDGGS